MLLSGIHKRTKKIVRMVNNFFIISIEFYGRLLACHSRSHVYLTRVQRAKNGTVISVRKCTYLPSKLEEVVIFSFISTCYLGYQALPGMI